MIDEIDPENQTRRRKIFGSGLSPVGFQLNLHPTHKFQPFATTNGGFLYYQHRVLAPDASRFMWTIDLGGGMQFFQTSSRALSVGYRYRHMSNANISHSNPGTDTNTFFFAISHFGLR
jgi:opacity protein-like surface antigen